MDWDEDTLTWNNAPAKGDFVGSVTITNNTGLEDKTGHWYEIDVTDYLKLHPDNKVVSFLLINEYTKVNASDVSFNSKEAEMNWPVLVVDHPGTFTVRLAASPAEGGVVTGSGDYAGGDAVSIGVVASDGYVFINWTDVEGNIVFKDAEATYNAGEGPSYLIASFKTVSIDNLTNDLNEYILSGDIGVPMAAQLTNSLTQAIGQRDIGHLTQSIIHMNDFVKHLENEALSKFITADVKNILRAYAQGLIKIWEADESDYN